MNSLRNQNLAIRWAGLALLSLVLAGCATTPKTDWSSRVGTYTYEQAVLELGPPDKYAKLSDGTQVAEWLMEQGYTRAYSPYMSSHYGFGPWYFGGWYPAYVDTSSSPSRYLRLIFGPDGILRDWKRFYK